VGWKGSLISLLAHAGAIAAIGLAVSEEGRKAAIAVAVRTFEATKPEEKKPPPPPQPDKPKPPKPAKPRPVVPSSPLPPSDAPRPSTSAGKVLDLGIMISGDAPGGVGVAVPVAVAPVKRTVEKPPDEKPVKRIAADHCADSVTKPVPIDKVAIEYPLEAREAGLSGRLVLRLHVNAAGEVEDVEVLESVGDALDRPAIEAVKRWKFTPASACGKAVKGTYTLARRFELGD
jgi:periplasmic protein TonB